MRVIIVLVLSIMIFSYPINAEETNYCHDKEANAEWEVLVEKYPNDMQVQALHALRIGLCVKVERGGINVNQATDIFEMARTSIIESKERQERRELEEAKKENNTS